MIINDEKILKKCYFQKNAKIRDVKILKKIPLRLETIH